MSTSSPVGEVLGITPQGLADTLKGMTWGVPIEGVMYDGEFTGEVSQSGNIQVKIKKKSDKQPENQ